MAKSTASDGQMCALFISNHQISIGTYSNLQNCVALGDAPGQSFHRGQGNNNIKKKVQAMIENRNRHSEGFGPLDNFNPGLSNFTSPDVATPADDKSRLERPASTRRDSKTKSSHTGPESNHQPLTNLATRCDSPNRTSGLDDWGHLVPHLEDLIPPPKALSTGYRTPSRKPNSGADHNSSPGPFSQYRERHWESALDGYNSPPPQPEFSNQRHIRDGAYTHSFICSRPSQYSALYDGAHYQSTNLFFQNENHPNFPQQNLYDQYNDTSTIPTSNTSDHDVGGGGYTADTNGFGQNIFQPQVGHQVLHHHLYIPLEPAPQTLRPNQRSARDLFIPENIRQRLYAKSEATLRNFGNSLTVHPYHTVTPLVESGPIRHNRSGLESTVYKAVDSRDGRTYCLRRIHNFIMDEITAAKVQTANSNWASIRNSSIVSFHLAFTTQDFGDRSLVMVYDYHPESLTLFQSHSNTYRRAPVPERLLWNYIVQIANAVKLIHGAGLAATLLDANKMLVTDEDRVRFNGCGIADILDSPTRTVEGLQQMDLISFGSLIVWLATLQLRIRPVDILLRQYPRLINIVEWLLQDDPRKTIDGFLEQISSAVVDSFDASLQVDDVLQYNLNRELENSRIVRMLLKLNSINERPEYEEDQSWSEYGTRGQIKLFRDYIFHQVDAQGRPVLDMGHMIACLNKLDVGLEEKVQLSTRDGKSFIVVTYREMKQNIESAWNNLVQRSAT